MQSVGAAITALVLAASVIAFLLSAGCDSKRGELPRLPGYYDGLEEDLVASRKTYTVTVSSDKTMVGSTSEAMAAAQRIFENIDFLGMTKNEVLALLGDPATISDYGAPAKPGPNEPLVYRYYGGWDGVIYSINFRSGRVVSVEGVPTY